MSARPRKRISVKSIVVILVIVVPVVVLGVWYFHARARATEETGELRRRMTGCSHLRIESLLYSEDPNFDPLLFETQDANEIDSLSRCISLSVCYSEGMCNCLGALMFEFYDGDDLVVAFSLHHGKTIRLQNRSARGDLVLSGSSRRRLRAWLAVRGIDPALYFL